jgi:hypothetical protein
MRTLFKVDRFVGMGKFGIGAAIPNESCFGHPAGKDKTPVKFIASAFQTIFAWERYLCPKQKAKKPILG